MKHGTKDDCEHVQLYYVDVHNTLLLCVGWTECTFAPATIAPMININVKRNPTPNPNPNFNLYPIPNQKPNHYPHSNSLLSEMSSQEQMSDHRLDKVFLW